MIILNKEQKAHDLALLYSKFFIEHNLDEYYDKETETFDKSLILSDLQLTYNEGYNYFSKN